MPLLRPEVFAEIACGTRDRVAFERETLAVMDDRLGFDVAWFAWPTGPSPVAPGLLDNVRAQSLERWHHYGREAEVLLPAAQRAGGLSIDRDVLSMGELERLDIYQDLQRPHGGKVTAVLFLHAHGQPKGRLVVGRSGRGRFSARERSALAASLPVLSLCLDGLGPTEAPLSTVPLPTLSPREREILSYLPLGYSNAQIGLALGTAERTVRNQLSRLFEKLGVANRAEAAALAVSHRVR